VTKNATLKMMKAVEELQGGMRFIFAAFGAMGLIDRGEEDGNPTSFVDPAWNERLGVLKRGFVGRLRWLLLGK